MTQIAWCESRWEPGALNPIPVEMGARVVHSSGLYGVLGGSLNPVEATAEAHALWLVQGWQAWRLDFADGCAWKG